MTPSPTLGRTDASDASADRDARGERVARLAGRPESRPPWWQQRGTITLGIAVALALLLLSRVL